MATETSAQLIASAFDAFLRRDIDALLALLDPDVRVRSLMTEAERRHYDGHQGVRDWLSNVLEVFPDWNPTIEEIDDVEAHSDSVVVRFHVTATGQGSGVRIDQDYWLGVRLRDGKAAYFGFFRTEEDAVTALEGER